MGQEFPSDGNIPSDYTMWQPRLGITWDPNKDGKTVVRASGGIFAARVPGLNLASTRSTNGTISYNASGAARGTVPRPGARLPEHPESRHPPDDAGPPGCLRLQQGLQEPAHVPVQRRGRARGRGLHRGFAPVQLRAHGQHHAVHQPERSSARLAVVDRPRAPMARTASGRSGPSSRRRTASTTGSRWAS